MLSALDLSNTNLFVYCKNNPIAYKDESGGFAIAALISVSTITGAVAGAVVSGLIYSATHQDSMTVEGFLLSVAGGAAAGFFAGASCYMTAATISFGATTLLGAMEGAPPDVVLTSALFSALSAFFGGIGGTKLANIISMAGDIISNFVGSTLAGISFEAASALTQASLGTNTTTSFPSASSNRNISMPGGSSSGVKDLDYWNKHYGDRWSNYQW